MASLEDNFTLSIILADFISSNKTLKGSNSYAVAVSGGPDSLTLASLLSEYALSADKELHVLTVDHALRAESKTEAEDVGKWVNAFNNKKIQHKILTWDSDKPEKALMETARHARYDLMSDYCQKNDIQALFVAHHSDDQAETILFRLSKGSGLDGLGGMEPAHAYNENLMLYRPFLDVPKISLVEYCKKHSLPFVTDPSNEKQEYARPRLRKAKAILEEEGLTAERLSATAKRMRRAREALEKISADVYEQALQDNQKNSIGLNWTYLKSQPEEISFRVVSMALNHVSDTNGAYNVRMKRLESLFFDLWQLDDLALFKRRSLGGCLVSFDKKLKVLLIEKK